MNKTKIMEASKDYWLNYFPLEEMPKIISIICEGYRKNLITSSEAISALSFHEKEIKNWIKTNNKLNETTI